MTVSDCRQSDEPPRRSNLVLKKHQIIKHNFQNQCVTQVYLDGFQFAQKRRIDTAVSRNAEL